MKKWILRSSLMLTLVSTGWEIYRFYQRIALGRPEIKAFAALDWGLFSLLVVVFLIGLAVLIWAFVRKDIEGQLERLRLRKGLYWGITVVLSLILLESIQDVLFIQAGLKEIYYPVSFLENRELLIWAAGISGQSLLAWLMLGWMAEVYQPPTLQSLPVWLIAGYLAVGASYLIRGMGSLPPNAPLPFLHILLIVLFTVLIGLLIRWVSSKLPGVGEFLGKDLIVFVILWVTAFMLWANVPLQSNYFIAPPRPPDYQYTPTSDAIYYEIQSQRLLVGEGFEEKVQHSLYNYFLSGLHLIGGDHYLDIYKLQIGFLAIIPFFIFKLAQSLYSPFAGWLAAVLVIVREYNALHLGDSITVSNVQELMTEPLAMLGVVLFLYLCVLWFKDRRGDRGKAVLVGAVVAATALVRVELLSLAFVFGFLLLGKYWRDLRKALIPGLLFTLSLMLVLMPWLVRNYQQTGQVMIDKGMVLVQTAQGVLEQPGISEPDINKSVLQKSVDTLSGLSLRIARKSSNSFKQTLVYLPSNHFPLGGLDTFIDIVPQKGTVHFFQTGLFSDEYLTRYIKSLPYWKVKWQGSLSARSILPQLLVIGFITTGVYQLVRRHRFLGLLPLITMFAHILVYSLVGYSGGRYIQVVDWITLFYLTVGITSQIPRVVKLPAAEFHPGSEADSGSRPGRAKWRDLSWAAALLVITLSMPIVESSIPRRYDLQDLEAIGEDVGNPPEGGECLLGKVLYPGYFGPEEIFLDDRAGRMPDPGRAQMVFYLVGTRNIWISYPAEEPQSQFPHGSEAAVCGNLVRNTPQDLENRLHPFFVAEEIVLLDEIRKGDS